MFASVGEALSWIAPEAAIVLILRIVFSFARYVLDDDGRWNRLKEVMMPLLVVAIILIGLAAWWLLCDGGVQLLLHSVGQTAIPKPHTK